MSDALAEIIAKHTPAWCDHTAILALHQHCAEVNASTYTGSEDAPLPLQPASLSWRVVAYILPLRADPTVCGLHTRENLHIVTREELGQSRQRLKRKLNRMQAHTQAQADRAAQRALAVIAKAERANATAARRLARASALALKLPKRIPRVKPDPMKREAQRLRAWDEYHQGKTQAFQEYQHKLTELRLARQALIHQRENG